MIKIIGVLALLNLVMQVHMLRKTRKKNQEFEKWCKENYK